VGTGSLAFAVRVKPGASATKVGGRYPGPHGPALVVAVSAPAVDGRATAAVLRAVAKALRVRPARITVTHGLTSRNKLLLVTDPPAELAERLARLRDGDPA
jgi:uncharacterized protein YggU (UPF0235/DUF167 family)